jgi:hypothetical protein
LWVSVESEGVCFLCAFLQSGFWVRNFLQMHKPLRVEILRDSIVREEMLYFIRLGEILFNL